MTSGVIGPTSAGARLERGASACGLAAVCAAVIWKMLLTTARTSICTTVPFVLAVKLTDSGCVPLLALAVTRSLPLFALIAFAPVLARTLRSLLSPEPHLNLKQIGIAEIVYSIIFLIFTTLTFRSMI